MKLAIMALGTSFAAAVTLCAAPPQQPKAASKEAKPAAQTSDAALIARGKYLVNGAGQCGDCHTPMNKKGQPIKSQALQGAPIMFKPTVPVPGWTDMSMPLVGLPTMASDEDAISFFTTGKHLNGKTAAPPMPQFRFNRKDAEAIVAYLKSLDQSAKK